MSIKGYKGNIVEIAKDIQGFENKCKSVNILNKLTEIEILEEQFSAINENNIKYYYDRAEDSLYKIECNPFQPEYYLDCKLKDNQIQFVSIFDSHGTSIDNEIQKILKG